MERPASEATGRKRGDFITGSGKVWETGLKKGKELNGSETRGLELNVTFASAFQEKKNND